MLPFTNLSGDASQEYFSDGLTEEMILQLGHLGRGRIGVISRSSSNVFKGSRLGAREIGETLRADYLLEGSVRREADRVRITAQLVETSSESHLWTDVYERHLTDCLSVQTEVAARIAQSLAVELLPEQPVHSRHDADAYQTYLQGRYYWNLPGDQGLEQAVVYFGQACAIGSEFRGGARRPGAHAHRACGVLPLDAAHGSRNRAADRGARAGTRQAFVTRKSRGRQYPRDARLGLGRGRSGIPAGDRASIPSSDGAHRWYGLAARRAWQIVPKRSANRSARASWIRCAWSSARGRAWTQYMAGDYQASIETCRSVMDMKRDFTPAWRVLGAALIQMGRAAEGVAELEAAAATAPADPVLLAWLAHAKALRGECGVATTILEALDRLRPQRFVPRVPPCARARGLWQTRPGVRAARSGVRRARPGAHQPRPATRGSIRSAATRALQSFPRDALVARRLRNTSFGWWLVVCGWFVGLTNRPNH